MRPLFFQAHERIEQRLDLLFSYIQQLDIDVENAQDRCHCIESYINKWAPYWECLTQKTKDLRADVKNVRATIQKIQADVQAVQAVQAGASSSGDAPTTPRVLFRS